MTTERQEMWQRMSEQEHARGNHLLGGFCGMLALPNENEREHACLDHSIGFSRAGRRGFKCGICKSILKWVDPEPNAEREYDDDRPHPDDGKALPNFTVGDVLEHKRNRKP